MDGDITLYGDVSHTVGDPHVAVVIAASGRHEMVYCQPEIESKEGVVFYARDKSDIDDIERIDIYQIMGTAE